MTTAITDTFKVVATPSQELQLELSNLAAKGNDAVNVAHKKPKDVEVKKDNERNDLALNVLQQISEQERIHQEYRKQAQQINYAIDMALAEASTPEERQEILDYQNIVEQVDKDIEQKREVGTLTQQDINNAEQIKFDKMPDTVKEYMPEKSSSLNLKENEIAELDTLSASSFASITEDSSSNNLSELNKSFQVAATEKPMPEDCSPDPASNPLSPAELSKFTF